MVADVDGGPCSFCAACGSWSTSKPRDLLSPRTGRKGGTAAGLAALVKFRRGLVPDCGGECGRRVHAVEALHSRAASHWADKKASEGRGGVVRRVSAQRAASEPPARAHGGRADRSSPPPTTLATFLLVAHSPQSLRVVVTTLSRCPLRSTRSARGILRRADARLFYYQCAAYSGTPRA